MVFNNAMDPDTVEGELTRLNAETRTLSEELVQCQADKDFVWSLWKRLQVANPDITQAIGMVMQREKEKTELKDRKVLEILQCKDDKIDEMQTIITKQSTELSEMLNKKVDLQEEKNILENENEKLKDKLSVIDLQLKGLSNREQSMDELFRKSVEGAETDKQELMRRIRDLTQELEIVKAEKSDNLSQRISLENKVRTYERDVTEKVARFEGLIREHEEAKRLLLKYENQNRQHSAELEFKSKELEAVRKELSDLWNSHNQLTEHSGQQADLIRQLQSLQQDTQRMLQTQEDAYSMESSSVQQMYVDVSTKYELLKKTESELRLNILDLKKILHDKDDVIAELQNRLDKSSSSRRHLSRYDIEGSFIAPEREGDVLADDIQYKINNMKKEINILRDKLEEKDRVIESLNKSIEFDVSHLNRERTHSTPSRDVRSIAVSPIRNSFRNSTKRNRSTSPTPGSNDLQRQLRNTERKLVDVESALKIKNRELAELKKAHTRRLDRLKTVQNNFRLVKEQLKLHEDDHGSKKKKKLKRADPRDLQKEDSDAVWNELAFFKNEQRSLAVENMALHEEVDSLRVQSSHDAATIHELKVALEQDREDYEYRLKRREIENVTKHEYENEIRELQSDIKSTGISYEKLSRDLKEVAADRERLFEERKILKSEIFNLKQADAEHRIVAANLKRNINRLERELDEKNLHRCSLSANSKSSNGRLRKSLSKSLHANRKSKVTLARQYQKALNRSIERMKNVFEDFNDEDWEELTETEETEDTGCTSDSLGKTIANVSHTKLHEERTTGTTTSSTSHRKPLRSKKSLVRTRSDPLRRRQPLSSSEKDSSTDITPSSSAINRRVVLRERATSPIGFLQEKWSSPKPSKSSKFSSTSPASRQLQSMKQRLYYLQQQLNTLRESRSSALKSVTELKESSSQLQADLSLSNQRLKLSKTTYQKLASDLEKLHKEKSDLELQLAMKDDSTTTVNSTDNKHRDAEMKSLESRLKASNTEVTRQSSNLKSLKSDNESLQEQIKSLHDKINRLERDNNQKRTLLEDQRMRLKLAQEKEKSEANNYTELDTKIKLLTDSNEKQRIQIESYKKRLNVVVKEKHECEEKMRKITSDLAKKTKQLTECQTRISDLESVICELDKTAKQQLHGLASQSEAAIETAQQKLSLLNSSLQQYQHFVKSFALELVSRVQRARSMLRDAQTKKLQTQKVDRHMEKAKTVAKDILNLSQSDLDDILSVDGDRADSEAENEKKKDKKWLKKCDKILGSKESFAMPLVELFLTKVEERNDVLSRLQNV